MARMTAEERREQVLDVTLALARTDGMHGLTMEAVARAAGVTRPLVYGIFGDLDGLLDALSDRERDRALADLAGALPATIPDEDPDAVLTRGVRVFADAVRAHPDRWHLILLPPDGTPARMRERIERTRAEVLGRLEALVRWALERRGGPDVDPELLARLILTLAQDAARLVLADPAAYPTARIEAFTAAALAALGPAR